MIEAAHLLGAVPLLWLCGLLLAGIPRGAAWWWLALAFGVSFAADTAAERLSPDVVGNTYPLLQAALVGAVLLDRGWAAYHGLLLTLAALLVLTPAPGGYDVAFRALAWGSVVVMAWRRPGLGLLRSALLVSFGAAGLAWALYAWAPSVESWTLYQVMRALGTGLFCVAALGPDLTGVIADRRRRQGRDRSQGGRSRLTTQGGRP